MKWSDLFAQGTLVDTDFGECRFEHRLEKEDLGIQANGEFKKAVRLGHIKLIPDSYLDTLHSIKYNAKKVVDENSLHFPLVPGARYIPVARRATVEGMLNEYSAQYKRAVENLIADYDRAKVEQAPEIKRALEDATKDKPETSEIVARTIQNISSQYPTAEEIRRKCYMSWKAFSIAAPIDKETAEAVEEETQNVKDVVSQMISRLRGELIEKIENVMSLVQKNTEFETLNGKTINSIEETCERLQGMNVLGDETLNQAINTLRSSLSMGSKQIVNSLENVRAGLQGNLDTAMQAASDRLTKVGKRSLDL